jgi:phosphate transport system substrate-binding protein
MSVLAQSDAVVTYTIKGIGITMRKISNFKKCVGGLLMFLSAGAMATEITGAGSYMPNVLYANWGNVYTARYPDITVKYTTLTPKEGLQLLADSKVDFAAIDMPLTKEQLGKLGAIQFPVVFTGAGIIINIPGIYEGQLKLDPITLTRIFMGDITKWNDPEIVDQNNELISRLPNETIRVIHRDTPKEVTTIIGDFLSKINLEWKTRVGIDMSGKWAPGTIKVKTADLMLEVVNKTPFSIGHQEISKLLRDQSVYIKLKNKTGNYVSPGIENIAAAAENVDWSSEVFDEPPDNQVGEKSWPMT